MHDVNSVLTTYKHTSIMTHNAARVEGTDQGWFFDVNENANWNSYINTYRGHLQGINNLIQIKIQITPVWKCQPLMLAYGLQSWGFYRCLTTRQHGEVWGFVAACTVVRRKCGRHRLGPFDGGISSNKSGKITAVRGHHWRMSRIRIDLQTPARAPSF